MVILLMPLLVPLGLNTPRTVLALNWFAAAKQCMLRANWCFAPLCLQLEPDTARNLCAYVAAASTSLPPPPVPQAAFMAQVLSPTLAEVCIA